MNKARRLIADRVSRNNLYTHLLAAKNERVDRRDQELELTQLSDVATDFGRITAGVVDVADGTVVADDNGLTLVPQTAFSYDSLIKWVANDGTGYLNAFLEADYSGSSPNRASSLILITSPELGGSGDSRFSIRARMPDGVNYNGIDVYTSLHPFFGYHDKFGNTGDLHLGEDAGFYSVDSTTAEEEMYFRTIAAESLGAYGAFALDFDGVYKNTSGTARNITIRAYVGGTGGTKVFDSGPLGCNNGRDFPYRIHIEGMNNADATAQSVKCTMSEFVINGIAASTTPTAWTSPTATENDVSIDSDANDIDIVITTQFGTSSSGLKSQRQHAWFSGPNNHTSS